MKSNIVFENDCKNVVFLPNAKSSEEMAKSVSKYFAPEFINRIDEIICFNDLDKESVSKIAQNYLSEYQKKFNFEMNMEEFVKELIEKEEIKKYGARYIKRELKKNIVKLLENKVEVA